MNFNFLRLQVDDKVKQKDGEILEVESIKRKGDLHYFVVLDDIGLRSMRYADGSCFFGVESEYDIVEIVKWKNFYPKSKITI